MSAFKTTAIVYCLLSLLSKGALAAPTGDAITQLSVVQKRNDESHPKPFNVDITNWEGISELNCYQMLCKHEGKRIWRRAVAEDANDRHRRANGADYQPFKADQLSSRHTEQITPQTVSAEEFPWASMEAGGEGAVLMPATTAEQRSQGGHIGGEYTRQSINTGDWFEITMNPASKRGKWCQALHQKPPNFKLCDEDPDQDIFGKKGVHIAHFAFILEKVGRPFGFRRLNPGRGKREIPADDILDTLQLEDDEEIVPALDVLDTLQIADVEVTV